MDEKLLQILKKTYKLFHKYGIRSLTMADIARENMISKKTLYNHVNDKADLIEKVLEQNIDQYQEHIRKHIGKANNAIEEIFLVQEKLISSIKEHNPSLEFDLRKYYPAVYNKIMLKNSKNIYENIKRNIKRGQQEGLYREDLDADLIAKSRLLLHLQRVDNEIVSYKEFTNINALKKMMLYHMRAVCTIEGLKKVDRMIDKLKKKKDD